MARSLTAAMVTEMVASAKRPIVFYEGEFSTGTLNLWSGFGDISWNAKTWNGVGHLAGISPIEETEGIRATGVRVSLSGIQPQDVSLALTSMRRHKPGRIWIGMLDANDAVIADPALAFEGSLDIAQLEDGTESATVTVTYESRLVDLERPKERRWTHEDQQIDFPGDLGFEFVESLQVVDLTWGGKGLGRLTPPGGGTEQE